MAAILATHYNCEKYLARKLPLPMTARSIYTTSWQCGVDDADPTKQGIMRPQRAGTFASDTLCRISVHLEAPISGDSISMAYSGSHKGFEKRDNVVRRGLCMCTIGIACIYVYIYISHSIFPCTSQDLDRIITPIRFKLSVP